MSKSLTVNGNVYTFPTSGTDPDWAKNVTGWAEEVTNVIDSYVIGIGDIQEQTFSNLLNGQTGSPIIIPNLQLLGSTVKSAFITYGVHRSVTNSSSKNETGTIVATYDPLLSTWAISQESNGDAGIAFSIDASGQLYYNTDLMTIPLGETYSGSITFSAKVLNT